jgi:hypothetical protein
MTGRNPPSLGSAADGDDHVRNGCTQPEDDRTAPVAADRPRMLDAALGYATRGIPVFPCHHPLPETHGRGWCCSCSDRDCSRAAKHPLTRHGLKDATARAEVITAWWQRWPQANIAIPTGAIFDVLDIYGPDGIRAIDKLGLSRSLRAHTPVARTGNGWHYLFTPTGAGNRVRVVDGLDWRGQGGYVIAPPSRHINGSAYRWVRPFDTVDLARVPTALANLFVREPRIRSADPLRTAPPAGQRGYGQAALAHELDRVRQAQPGQRNHTLNRAAFRCSNCPPPVSSTLSVSPPRDHRGAPDRAERHRDPPHSRLGQTGRDGQPPQPRTRPTHQQP